MRIYLPLPESVHRNGVIVAVVHVKVGHRVDPIQMDQSGEHNENVKDLMRLKQVVTLAREESLRNTIGVQQRPDHIEHALKYEQAESGHESGIEYNVPVDAGHHIGQAKREENQCPKTSILGLTKLVPHGHNDGENTENQSKAEVEQKHIGVLVEAVVESGRHGANDLQ